MTLVCQMVSSQSGIIPKLPGKYLTKDYGKPLFMWIITKIATMITSWEWLQLNRASMTRNLMIAWRPLYFRSNSKIVYNRSVTMGWYPITRKLLMKKYRGIYPRYPDSPPSHQLTVYRVCEKHAMAILIQISLSEVQQLWDVWVRENPEHKFSGA